MKYQVQENCLTIYLPREVDHHNAEEIKAEAVHTNERIRKILTLSGVTKIMQIYEEERV